MLRIRLNESRMRPVHRLIQMLCPDIPQQHTLAETLEIVLREDYLRLLSRKH